MSKRPCKDYPMSKACTQKLKRELRKCPPHNAITSNISQQRSINKRIAQLRAPRKAMFGVTRKRTYKQVRAKKMTKAERSQAAFHPTPPKTSTDAAANFLYQQALAAKNTQQQQSPGARDESKQERMDVASAQAQKKELRELREWQAKVKAVAREMSGGGPGSRRRAAAERDAAEVRLRGFGAGTSSGTTESESEGRGMARRTRRARTARAEARAARRASTWGGGGVAPLRDVRDSTDSGTATLPLGGMARSRVNQTQAQARRQSSNGISGGGRPSSISRNVPDQRSARVPPPAATLGGMASASPFLGGAPPRGVGGGSLATAGSRAVFPELGPEHQEDYESMFREWALEQDRG